MARKSGRLSSGSKAAPSHKRAASKLSISITDSKRSRMKKATPTKSRYFEDQKDDGRMESANVNDVETASPADDDASEFEDSEEESPDSDPEGEGDYDSDEEPKKRKKPTPRKGSTSRTTTSVKESELWKPGVKTGLGPGTQVIIKKPKARAAGKTPYSDDTIHPNTLLFLKDLKANNNRDWLKMQDADFRQSEADWKTFVEKLTERLIEVDETIPELPVKDIIFRIYRDVRFSPDPTPYKPHFSAAWSRTGRKGPYATYYVQIAPNQSFVGGGLWHPEAAPTAAMRNDIDINPSGIKNALLAEGIRKSFLGIASKVEAKVVKAFVSANSENALKTKPKGFNADHPDIDLLRLRNYTIGKKLTNDEVVGAGGLDRVVELLSNLKPFIVYLNSVVMPDDAQSEIGDDAGEDASEE